MRISKQNLIVFILLIVIAALYRLVPDRSLGFAPHIALALFGGAVIKDKKWAFALPLLSMFISDLLFQVFYMLEWTPIYGFYEGQFTNYLLFAGLTLMGFLLRDLKPVKIILGVIAGPVLFFLASNFFVWVEGAGYARPKTWEGLLMCYTDGLPFFRGSMEATLFFSVLLFGGYFLVKGYSGKKEAAGIVNAS